MSIVQMFGSLGNINSLCRDIKVSKGQISEIDTIK